MENPMSEHGPKQHKTTAHGLCYGLKNRAPHPAFLSLFRSVLCEAVRHGGNAILKHTEDRAAWVGMIVH